MQGMDNVKITFKHKFWSTHPVVTRYMKRE